MDMPTTFDDYFEHTVFRDSDRASKAEQYGWFSVAVAVARELRLCGEVGAPLTRSACLLLCTLDGLHFGLDPSGRCLSKAEAFLDVEG
ncbi:hypothetical protein RI054_06g35360 [Pseudoscourfieldia marina]